MAYRPNIEAHPENRAILSDGWHTYFGFRIPPEEIQCDGCKSKSQSTLDQDCPVRPCAQDRDIENCASCLNYVCENLSQRLIDFESIQANIQEPIPEQDRQKFILPYENAHRLKILRGD
jgi:hypothetical protein